MDDMVSSVSPKGQITIPASIRKRLGVKPRDRVMFVVEGDEVKIVPFRSRLEASYQAVPALDPPRTLEEMAEIAWAEHVQDIAREGV